MTLPLSPTATAGAATAIAGATLAFGLRFRIAQNRNTESGKWVGGAISWPKSFWLGYTILNWFFMPLVFFFNPEVSEPVRVVIGLHLASWWIRGVLELVMIYRWFNWSPVYGISHDILHNVMLIGGLTWATSQIGASALNPHLLDFWATLYLFVTTFAIMGEILFAALFIMTREKGAGKIYFASDSPEFRMINRFTLAVCIAVYTHLVAEVVGLWAR
jgi:hypothetical protein